MRRAPSDAAILAIALACDVAFGEPPNALHPVSWLGRLVARLRAALQRHEPSSDRTAGMLTCCIALAASAVPPLIARRLPRALASTMLVAYAASTFSLRELLAAAGRVAYAIDAGDLPLARLHVRALVGRPTGDLDAGALASSAVESLAENFVDSVAAPLFYYAAGGPLGAGLFRASNTLDSMLGYRTPELIHFGRAAARLDDVLCYAPARIGACALLATGALAGIDGRRGLAVLRRDRHRTPSPNGGWAMAAIAGLLGVRLEKRGVHVLNAAGRAPTTSDIRRAQRIVFAAGLTAGVITVALRWWLDGDERPSG